MGRALVIGSRGSALALVQSEQIADAIRKEANAEVTVRVFSTRGDEILDRPLPEIGGKGLFTLELEQALLAGEIDLAVHSLKDLPTEDPEGLVLGAIPARADARDALVGCSLEDLPTGCVVATGSLRRRSQLASARPDLKVIDIRGNVPTRLEKRDKGLCDATILAVAGLDRLGIERADIFPLAVSEMVPAVAQGALGVQCRADDAPLLSILAGVDDEETRLCVTGERAFLRQYGGGCNVPAGCHIRRVDRRFALDAVVSDEQGALRRFHCAGDDPTTMAMLAVDALA
ncbi:MAG: hydroxymethylbilane synthase [Myxococcota bacterium]|nr:hydroxymethylbilane synthase [Myxococcota bacterium]MEC9391114.1 hydroxymethylbilane synthase [Myxococcota bacterium]